MEERDLLSDLQDVSDSERKTSSAESSSGDCSPGPAQLGYHRASPKFTAACFLPKAESGSGSEEEEEEEEEEEAAKLRKGERARVHAHSPNCGVVQSPRRSGRTARAKPGRRNAAGATRVSRRFVSERR